MSDSDRRLHDLMELAVGDPPRQVTPVAVRRRSIRRRAGTCAAACAVILAAGGLGSAASWAAGHGQGAASPAASAAGVPRYYLEQVVNGAGDVTARVRRTATGAVTGTVACPRQARQPGTFIAGRMVAARRQVFYLDCQSGNLRQPRTIESRIYRFALTAAGRAGRYTPLPGGVLRGQLVDELAVSADGSVVAAAVEGPGGNDGVIVTSTRTGARAVWRNGPGTPGSTELGVGDLSLSANGQELAFLARPHCVKGSASASCTPEGEEVRALWHATSGGSLLNSRVLMHHSALTGLDSGYINDAWMTPDGQTLHVVTIHNGYVSVVDVSTRTGRTSGLYYRVYCGNEMNYGAVSPDPSGRYLIFDVGSSATGRDNGWIDHGRKVPLRVVSSQVIGEAW